MKELDIHSTKNEINKLIQTRLFDKAISNLEKLIHNNKNNDKLYALIGDTYLHIDKKKAESYYIQGYDINKNNYNINIGLGFIYFNNKDFVNAEKYLTNAFTEDPANTKLLTSIGKISKSLKKYDKAIKYYKLCEMIDKNNSFALYGLADTFRWIGNNEKALEYWLKFHEIEKKNKVAMTRIGDCYTKKNDYEKAIIFYNRALNIGYDFYAFLGLAKIYQLMNDNQRALNIYRKIFPTEKNNSRYYYEFINFCISSSMKEKARDLYNSAINIFPENSIIESLGKRLSL